MRVTPCEWKATHRGPVWVPCTSPVSPCFDFYLTDVTDIVCHFDFFFFCFFFFFAIGVYRNNGGITLYRDLCNIWSKLSCCWPNCILYKQVTSCLKATKSPMSSIKICIDSCALAYLAGLWCQHHRSRAWPVVMLASSRVSICRPSWSSNLWSPFVSQTRES